MSFNKAKKMLGWLAMKLPWGAQEAIFEAYCEKRGRYKVFTRLCGDFNIQTIGVKGRYGEILGSTSDQVVIAFYAKWGWWSGAINELLDDFFAGGAGTYFDVGANLGLTTIPLASKGGVRCVAFEPDPRNFSYLEKNVAANAPDCEVELHNVAITNVDQPVTLELSPWNLGDHRLRMAENLSAMDENSWETIQVEGKRLDDFLDRVVGPFAVKIDVQGAEPLVVAGGTEVLRRADLAIIEFSPYWIDRMGADPNTLIDYVSSFPKVSVVDVGASNLQDFSTGESAAADLRKKFENYRKTRTREHWDVVAKR